MTARGLTPEGAQRLLVQAFIGDALAAIDDHRVREPMLERALDALEGARL